MKLFALVGLSALSLSSFASEVKTGDQLADVRLSLGAPNGEVRVGDREIFYYDRGEIEAKSGVVTRAVLRTEEEQAAWEARRSRAEERSREEREIREARLNAEGEALKARKVADGSFQAMPLSYQVAFWEDFSRHYPGVGIIEQLADVRLRLAGEIEEKRKQDEQNRRMADLEARIAIAESEARFSRRYDYGPAYGFARGYAAFGNDVWRQPRRERVRPEPVTRMYEFPLPYATSPGMPPMQPVYRNDSLNGGFLNGDNLAGRVYSPSSSRGYRRF